MSQFLIRLKHWLHYNNFKGNYHFVVVILVLTFLLTSVPILEKFFIASLIIGLLIYIFIKHKQLFLLSITITLSIISVYFFKIILYNNAKEVLTQKLIVKEVEETERYQKVILSNGYFKYLYYNKKDSPFLVKVGDIYYIDGRVEKQNKESTPHGFDYARYLKYQNIVGVLETEKIEYQKNIFVVSSINNRLSRYYDNHLKNASIVKALVIGEKTGIDDSLLKNIQAVGITHLFVVSGLHVGILIGILEIIFKKTKLNTRWKNMIIYIFLGGYLVITNFMVSVIRVCLGYFLKTFLKNDFTPLDKMSINIIIVLFINPFYLFTYSFILTYLISSMIIFISPILINKKGVLPYILNSLIISISSIIITLPIVININSQINLLCIIFNIIYIPFVSYVLLPLSIILTFFPAIEPFVSFLYVGFIYSINILSKYNFLTLSFPVLNTALYLVYYMLILLMIYMFERRRWPFVFILIAFVIAWYNKSYFDLNDKIVFLDVSEGDATHIKTAFNKYNIVIDTGINTDDTIISYLQKEGIRKIDLLIISHGDSDHNGNLAKILKKFKVKCVILSVYDYNTYQILKENDYNKYLLVKRGDTFSVGNIQFEVLWPFEDMYDVNNNSIVFKMYFNNTSFLFTGDIERVGEDKLIDLEKEIKIDVLKIAHHGSNTSTHQNWLNKVKFQIGVAMTGDKNTFGFPNKFTVERLKKYEVYYTSECDTIIFLRKIWQSDWKIKFLREE